MRKIYTGVDIGSDAIKIVTIEKHKGKFNVLASVSVSSSGIKKGLITDVPLASASIKKCLKELETKLGTKIDKVVATVPSNNREFEILTGSTIIKSVDETVTGDDVYACLQDAVKGSKEKGVEVITVTPVEYTLDSTKNIKNPIGMYGKDLKVKVVVATVPRKNLVSIVKVFEAINVEVVDATFSSIGDYYAVKNDDLDRNVVVMVNIGSETTDVSIFNKGVMVKNQILDIGSDKIDNDISFVHKISNKEIDKIKKTFAVASRKYADKEEIYRLSNKFNVKIEINQYELAEIIEARMNEILKTIKRRINDLTNKQIGYIIITGGITDMMGMGILVDDIFVRDTTILNLNILGIRSNIYSSSYGVSKYLDEKLDSREKNYTMLNDTQVEEMTSPRKKAGVSSMLSKIFDRLFE